VEINSLNGLVPMQVSVQTRDDPFDSVVNSRIRRILINGPVRIGREEREYGHSTAPPQELG
jgi:hypothetical protein